MIYNLKKFLENEFPAEVFRVDARHNPPDRFCHIINTGGVQNAWDQYVTDTIQIITRDVDSPKAYELANDIYNKINDRFGLILPANIVGTTNYPEIQIAQISANAKPGYIGDDENGRSEFSANYRIIYRRN